MSTRRDPFEQMNRMIDQMRRSMTGDAPGLGGTGVQASSGLRAERTDAGLVVLADLPGFDRSDIEVTVEDGVLLVEADSDERDESEDRRSHHRRSISERMTLPDDADADEAEATYRNGVLEVTFPADGDTRRIDVE